MKKISLSIVFLFIINILSAQNSWDLLNPTPSYETGVDIHFFTDQHGFIITNNFELLETTDAGGTWEVKQIFPEFDRFDDFAFLDSLGFIVGENGLVLKTTDSGATWNEINIGIDVDLYDVNIFDGDTIYISGRTKFAKTTDGGTTWINSDYPNSVNLSIQFINAEVGIAAGIDGTIIKTVDGGLSWYYVMEDVAFTSDFVKVFFYDDEIGFASRKNGDLYKTINGGETWEMIPNVSEALYAFQFVNENIGFASGENSALLKTIDGGTTWEWVSFQEEGLYNFSRLFGLYFFDENNGFAVGDRGRIAKTTDGATTWDQYSPTYIDVNQIIFSTSSIGYARMGNDIFKTIDAGDTWESIDQPLLDQKTESLYFINENVGFAIVGGEPSIFSDPSEFVYKTIDGGAAWIPSNGGNPLEENVDLISIDFIDENIGYASGNVFAGDESVFKTINGGDTWEKVGEQRLVQMKFITESLGYGYRQNQKTLFRTTDGGVSWNELIEFNSSIFDFYFIDSDNGYIVTSAGMYKTENAGINWAQIVNAPSTTLENVEFVTKDFGYISTGTKIYRTNDAGQTWEFEIQTRNISDIAITDEKVYIGAITGIILASNFEIISSEENLDSGDMSIELSPNPTEGFVHINNKGKNKITSVSIFDINGKEIQSEQLNINNQIQLSLPQISKGMYVVKILLENKRIVGKKLIIK